jgi:signal transduction histidine kinase
MTRAQERIMDGETRTAAASAGPTRATGAAALAPATAVFVTVVFGLAAVVSASLLAAAPPRDVQSIVVWSLVALASQVLSFHTPTRRGEVTLGTSVHLCMALVLDASVLLPALWLSRLAAVPLQRGKAWYKTVFNASQVVLAVTAAWGVSRAVAGVTTGQATLEELARIAPAFLFATFAYYVVNMALVSVAIGLDAGLSPWRAWRENFGFASELIGTAGLALLAPVAAVLALALGPIGLALLLVPMLFIRDASERYVTLRRAQERLVESERSAARWSLGTEVGKELVAFLVRSKAQLQLLRIKRDRFTPEELDQRLGQILDELAGVEALSKRLLDFAAQENAFGPTRLDRLVDDTLAMLRIRGALAGVRVTRALDARIGEVRAEPTLLQHVIVRLVSATVEGMAGTGVRHPVLEVTLERRSPREAVIGIAGSGPGLPPELHRRIFDPCLVNRPAGYGPELVMALKAAHHHEGSIVVEKTPEGGSRFVVTLPLDRATEETRAAA